MWLCDAERCFSPRRPAWGVLGGGGIPLGKPTLGVTRLGFLPSVRLPAELDFFIFLSAEGQAKVLSSLPLEVGTPELVSEGGQGHK